MPANKTIVVDEREFKFKSVRRVAELGNLGQPWPLAHAMTKLSVTATKTVTLRNATSIGVDFSDLFAFPALPIVTADAQITLAAGFARHAVRPPLGQTVRIDFDEPVTANITVTATQQSQ